MKSHTGAVMTLGKGAICSALTQQKLNAKSSTKAEVIRADDAMLQVLDGEAAVNIDGKEMTVGAGQVVVMPANVPHSVTGVKRFKMLLTVVKIRNL